MHKQAIRESTWDRLEAEGLARFPFPPHDRIPNFAGAAEAADRLDERSEWRTASTIKANPDAPQLPVRRQALRQGKTVYMAVPRLREAACFVELDPSRIDDTDAAATVSAMDDYGIGVAPEDVARIDLIVAGSVAVTPDGARIGKGEGYSDLEYAILREFDRVDGDTPLATTVHDIQVVDESVELDSHDVPLDLIVTPTRTIHPKSRPEKPAGIDWTALSDERIEEIPVLARLREQA